MPYYEVREGDGNVGCFYKTTIKARDIDNALNKVRYNRLINLKRYWRNQLVIDGDDKHLSLCLYPGRNDDQDYCPYVMDIFEIDAETAHYNMTKRNY